MENKNYDAPKSAGIWAIRYIDKNGYTTSTGYAYALDEHKPGDITEDWSGQRILWDFELSPNSQIF